jgi:hypothetical protein
LSGRVLEDLPLSRPFEKSKSSFRDLGVGLTMSSSLTESEKTETEKMDRMAVGKQLIL